MKINSSKIKFSPLFWPVRLQGDTISILDETMLPHKESYVTVSDYEEAAAAIRQMKTRAVGQVILVLYTFLLVYRQNKGKKDIAAILETVADTLNKTRPTLSFKTLSDMVLGWFKAGKPLEEAVVAFLEWLKQTRLAQAKKAASLLHNKDTILTHCNVSGLLPLIAWFCAENKKSLSFFVTETRPYLQGSRLTAWELVKAGCDVTVIADNMVAQVMKEKKVNVVIVGADNMAKNGDIANKIGTYQIALLAKHFKIPFYVLCPPVSEAKTGADIKVEVRPDEELLVFNNARIAPQGVKAYYPAFDITPAALISKHIHLKV